jgi:uncharacterized protein
MTDHTSPINGPLDEDSGSLVVPLFPLPNVVLFPKAVLPLHIFEERYKAMTADALSGHKRIAMALLQRGWEKSYYSRPMVEPIVCVGQILQHERLPDGKYNFLLQGRLRARLVRELNVEQDGDAADVPYRLGVLQPLEERMPDPDAVADRREALRAVFAESAFADTSLGQKFLDLTCSTLPPGDLVDLMAFNFVEDVPAKQLMLAETDVARRMELLIDALGSLEPSRRTPMVSRISRPSLN